MIIVIVPYAFPYYWVFLTSVLPRRLLTMSINEFSLYRLFPYDQMSIRNYMYVLFGSESRAESFSEFSVTFVNTLILSLLTVMLIIPISMISGYALSTIKFSGRKPLNFFTWLLRILPTIGGTFVLFRIFSTLRLIDTYPGLLILFIGSQITLATILIRNFILSIPPELEESAMVMGCSRLGALFRVYLPLLGPGITTVSILAFLLTWNSFFVPLVFAGTQAKTVQIALTEFTEKYRVHYGQQAAAIMISMIPSILFLIFFSKHLLRGMAKGALKM